MTYADDIKRHINNQTWTGVLLVGEEYHDFAKWLAGEFRREAIPARVIRLKSTGSASGRTISLTARSVVIVPDSVYDYKHYLIKFAADAETVL